MSKPIGLISLVFPLLFALSAQADYPNTTHYALLVGSHRQGHGQSPLRFAQNDAMAMKSVLTDIGKYASSNVEVLVDPEIAELAKVLGEFEAILTERASRDEPSVFLFYYSGHARSGGLNLGHDEVSLLQLRQRIEKLPATVTLIILDACQSGAISNVKGVAPSADFSFNSVEQLNTEGTVVMASSTSSELSQESQTLEGSFFTHHLTVGLRGVADADQSGTVTLSEAYDYAYNTTLRATATTAVGKQHATLETDLRGKGDMVLTWPKEASAKIALPTELTGEMLITHVNSNTVVAEIHKAVGENLEVALPPGTYEALVKYESNKARKCEIHLADNTTSRVAIEHCEKIALRDAPTKGLTIQGDVEPTPKPDRKERLALELHLGLLAGLDTDYTRRLADFRYEDADKRSSGTVKVDLVYTPLKYLSILIGYASLDYRTAIRDLFPGDRHKVKWQAHRLGLQVRGKVPLLKGLVIPYFQAGGGYAWTRVDFFHGDGGHAGVDEDTSFGYHLASAAGLQLNPWKYLGFTLPEIEYVWAPSIKNEIGDAHNAGGLAITGGIRVGF
ncbi:MAG: caspase family protein [Myxococcota bacterium]|nr:caspase family protein [Myxococcota bacterium]